MVNEWVYCPRLAYLEWVEGEWADTGDTAQGQRVHRRVDTERGNLPAPEESDQEFARASSVTLSSETLGIIAKMDVVETQGDRVVPVDFKKGKRPHVAAGAYEPERAQLCAQGLVLEDNGYTATEGALWFAGSRERVYVRFDEELRERTRAAISELRLAAASGRRPPPLEDSPKCTRCSLAGICLTDETNFFAKGQPPRPLNPADDPALPLYVQTPGARVRKQGERLVVEADDEKVEVPMIDVSQVALLGPVAVTTPTLRALMRAEVPVSWMSSGGWLLGHTVGTGSRNVAVREAQFRTAADERRRMAFSRELVAAKIRNTRPCSDGTGDPIGPRRSGTAFSQACAGSRSAREPRRTSCDCWATRAKRPRPTSATSRRCSLRPRHGIFQGSSLRGGRGARRRTR